MRPFLIITVFSCLSSGSPALAGDTCSRSERVKYEGGEYCLKHDPQVVTLVLERNRLMALLNESHQMITRVGKQALEKGTCAKTALESRDAQLSCLQKLYEVKEVLRGSIKQSYDYKDRVNALNLPASLKTGALKNLSEFENGTAGALIALEKSIAHAEATMRSSLNKWLDINSEKWRNEGANRAFCGTLQGSVSLAKSWLGFAYRSESQGDTYGVREAYAKLAAANAKAKHGYKLCGFPSDETSKGVEVAYEESKAILLRQDVQANLKRVCNDPSVKKWQTLVAGCTSKNPSDAYLFSIHNALGGQYQEEK